MPSAPPHPPRGTNPSASAVPARGQPPATPPRGDQRRPVGPANRSALEGRRTLDGAERNPRNRDTELTNRNALGACGDGTVQRRPRAKGRQVPDAAGPVTCLGPGPFPTPVLGALLTGCGGCRPHPEGFYRVCSRTATAGVGPSETLASRPLPAGERGDHGINIPVD